ncbi:MAG: PGDYG domain-containing protein [Bacteroidia bacterium]|nr:PGDYG domain-containing protein [Bacteroidia bacterium]MBT8309235.1 PGDYG domain-containing protein [Bacteroidia bacterium]NND09832.1 hypothetical protein [Flavobacteriaceae bacterium]NNK27064.1 hypothetical protein [Flavobacteriaceae bacterium]NNL59710.1 hypothetical protein [Flavobacteriaceae bacterium]
MRKFKKGNPPDVTYQLARKKPIPIKCIQIDEPFTVETMEGLMKGKKGDWLVIGIHGEMYPIDNDIFVKTYDLIAEK